MPLLPPFSRTHLRRPWTTLLATARVQADGIWSLLLNAAVAIGVSAFTQAPSADTVRRVHGELERFVYGSTGEAMESDLAEVVP